ncbi:hypothetical protein STENM327S_08515 [Streptomyces tendae]
MSTAFGSAAVAAPAVLTVPMSTTSASSHLSALRMHPPCETDVRRKLSEQLPRHQSQQRIQPELTEPPATFPVTHTQRFPACTVTGPAR